MAKYPYIVNKDGVWYPAGTEVPEGTHNIKTENNAETTNNVVLENKTEYTKTEINRMSTAELQELAKEQGIEDAESITGGELKKILIEKFEL